MASSSEPAPTKRPRTDSDEPVTFTHSDLWWEDGNIVIQAETTQFRVYKGHLATHSEIFRDMFSIPQPSMDPKETVEGCPVVQVSDTAEDWTYILQALLERRYVYHFTSILVGQGRLKNCLADTPLSLSSP